MGIFSSSRGSSGGRESQSCSENEENVSFSLEPSLRNKQSEYGTARGGGDHIMAAPVQKRRCTDVICCGLFTAFFICLCCFTSVLIAHSPLGTPRDLDGNACEGDEILWNRYCIKPGKTSKWSSSSLSNTRGADPGFTPTEKCPQWRPGRTMLTQEVTRRRVDPNTGDTSITDRRYLPVDFVSRYVPTLKRCLRYKVQPARYCIPRDTLCFPPRSDGANLAALSSAAAQIRQSSGGLSPRTDETSSPFSSTSPASVAGLPRGRRGEGDDFEFRGCCPDQVLKSFPQDSSTAFSPAERNFLQNDVACYYVDGFGQFLPFNSDTQSNLLADYTGTIDESRKQTDKLNNQITKILWLVSNRQQMDYESSFYPSVRQLGTPAIRQRNAALNATTTSTGGTGIALLRAGVEQEGQESETSSSAMEDLKKRIAEQAEETFEYVEDSVRDVFRLIVQEKNELVSGVKSMWDRFRKDLQRWDPRTADESLDDKDLPLVRSNLYPYPPTSEKKNYFAPTESVARPTFTATKRAKFCGAEYADGGQSDQAETENQLVDLVSRWGFQIYDIVRNDWAVVLVLGVVFPVLLGCVCLWLIPHCIRVLTWIIYAVSFLFIILGNLLLLLKAGWLPSALLDRLDADNQEGCHWPQVLTYNAAEASFWQKWAIVGLVAGAVLLLLLVLLKRRIDVGLKLLQTTGRVILELPGILWFGFLGILLTGMVIAIFGYPVWLMWAMNLDEVKAFALVQTICGDSLGQEILGKDVSSCANALSWSGFIFMLFGFFWVLFFLNALLETCTALCVSKWYFERNDPESMFYDLEHDRACFRALCLLPLVVSKHAGSCAFGAFLLSVCWTLQVLAAILRWAKEKARRTVTSPAEGMLGVSSSSSSSSGGGCSCCSLERILLAINWAILYVTGQAFIFVAIEGRGFCRSAVRVTKLMLQHPAQCATNVFLTRLVKALLLLLVPACTWLLAFLVHNIGLQNSDCGSDIAKSAYEQLLVFGEEGFTVPVVCAGISVLMLFSLTKTYTTAVDALYICIFRDQDKFHGRYLKNCPQLQSLMEGSHKDADEK